MQDKKSISELAKVAKELLDTLGETPPKFIMSESYLKLQRALEESKPKPLNIYNPFIEQNIKFSSISQSKPPSQAEVEGFDNSTLNQIMNDDMIDSFLEHEKRLKADGYINSENKWISGRGKNQTKTLKDLANLILLLKEKNYLKSKFDKKHLKDNNYKEFFEVRYGYNLKEQFLEANRNTTKSLETAKITFFYF